MMENEMKQEIIMENYLNPVNKGEVCDDNYVKVKQASSSCIDNIDLYILFEDDIVKDIHFDGEACAISTSATSIMIKLLIGKSIKQVKELINNYYNMINEKEYDADILEEAIVYDEIYKQQNRKGCALIPWKALEKAIKEYEEKK